MSLSLLVPWRSPRRPDFAGIHHRTGTRPSSAIKCLGPASAAPVRTEIVLDESQTQCCNLLGGMVIVTLRCGHRCCTELIYLDLKRTMANTDGYDCNLPSSSPSPMSCSHVPNPQSLAVHIAEMLLH